MDEKIGPRNDYEESEPDDNPYVLPSEEEYSSDQVGEFLEEDEEDEEDHEENIRKNGLVNRMKRMSLQKKRRMISLFRMTKRQVQGQAYYIDTGRKRLTRSPVVSL